MGNSLKRVFDPENPPKPGDVFMESGFKYVCQHVKPHRNQHGDPSLVITWEAYCAEDGKPFTCKSGAKVYSMPRRCKDHNIGWAKAWPFGTPRPENAPKAGKGLNEGATVKAFLDRWGRKVENGVAHVGDIEERADLDEAHFVMCEWLEAEYPGILSDEPDAADLLK